MIGHPRSRPPAVARPILVVLAAVALAGCGGPPSIAPPSIAPPTASASATTASPSIGSAQGSADTCPLPGVTLDLPRKRLVAVTVPETPGLDSVVFSLGGDPGSGARLEVTSAAPPFSRGGQALDIEGRRVLELRFVGVETRDATGAPVFQGPRDLEPDLPAIRRLTVFDETDGLIAWYLGLAGSGCLTLGVRGDDGILLIATHDP